MISKGIVDYTTLFLMSSSSQCERKVVSISDELSLSEVDKLFGPQTGQQKVDAWPQKSGLVAIYHAVKGGSPTVQINGRLFTIRSRSSETYYLKPVRGYVPCG